MSRRTTGRRVEKLLTMRLSKLAIVCSSCELCVCLGDQAFCDVLGEVLGDVLGEVHGDVPSERCSEEDKIATQRAKAFYLAWVLYPLVFGDYPDVMKRTVGERCVSKDCQFQKHLFVNPNTLSLIVIYLQFDMLPWGLEGVLKYIKQNYGNLPVYILENGINLSLSLVPYLVSKHYRTLASTPRGLVEFLCKYTLGQPTNQQSSINDLGRVEYLHAYIAAVLDSVRCAHILFEKTCLLDRNTKTLQDFLSRSGSDIRGYFQWSFMDMFEFINPNYTYGLYYVISAIQNVKDLRKPLRFGILLFSKRDKL
ncbi:hypothetical protein F2Q68_00003431, partial [Brassica cretica]